MVFGKPEGLSGIADDTFVYGIGEIQHDPRILNVLDTKMKSDKNKIKAIRNMPPPTNLAELQSFIGMINYMNGFSPIIAQTSEPVRQLISE